MVIPNPSSLSLSSYSTGTFTFTIPINDELQERIPVDLSDMNPGTPIAIKAYLNQLENPTMFVIQMNPEPTGVWDVVKGAYGVVVKIKNEVVGKVSDYKTVAGWVGLTKAIQKSAERYGLEVSSKTAGGIAGIFVLYIEFVWHVMNEPIPPDDPGDNNLIIGDN